MAETNSIPKKYKNEPLYVMISRWDLDDGAQWAVSFIYPDDEAVRVTLSSSNSVEVVVQTHLERGYVERKAVHDEEGTLRLFVHSDTDVSVIPFPLVPLSE